MPSELLELSKKSGAFTPIDRAILLEILNIPGTFPDLKLTIEMPGIPVNGESARQLRYFDTDPS
jgi:hypothetical protein